MVKDPLNRDVCTLIFGYFFPLFLQLLVLGLLILDLCFLLLIDEVSDLLTKVSFEFFHLINDTFDRNVGEVVLVGQSV